MLNIILNVADIVRMISLSHFFLWRLRNQLRYSAVLEVNVHYHSTGTGTITDTTVLWVSHASFNDIMGVACFAMSATYDIEAMSKYRNTAPKLVCFVYITNDIELCASPRTTVYMCIFLSVYGMSNLNNYYSPSLVI